jgi:cytoskeletal protein RodZ
MDKFEQSIREARRNHEPAHDFVNSTMQLLQTKHSRKRWSLRLLVPIVAGAVVIVIVLVVFVIRPGSVGNNSKSQSSNQFAQNSGQSQDSDSPSNGQSSAADTSNSSLRNELNGIQSTINQENTDQSSANSSLNDSQNQITIPTS